MVGITGALLVPFALLSAYFLLAGPSGVRVLNFDFPVLTLSVFAGAACLAVLPVEPFLRLLWFMVYFPIFVCLAIMYSLLFACAVFGDCL